MLCATCFSDNHKDHATDFHIAAGNGGCCDCGDQEAWKVPMQCKLHCAPSRDAFERPAPFVAPDILASIEKNIHTLLDFCAATLMRAPKAFDSHLTLATITSQDPPDPLIGPDSVYSCILWNDESHSFDEVIHQAVLALGVTEAQARTIAETVDARVSFL